MDPGSVDVERAFRAADEGILKSADADKRTLKGRDRPRESHDEAPGSSNSELHSPSRDVGLHKEEGARIQAIKANTHTEHYTVSRLPKTTKGGYVSKAEGGYVSTLKPHANARGPPSTHSHSQPSRSSADTQILSQDEVDEKPWKYIGYRGYSEFVASENDFFMLRRFGAVSTRVALMLQDQVVVLEDELRELDRKYSGREAVGVNNGTFRDDEKDRLNVLEKLRLKLVEYNEFVLQQAELKKHPNPSAQDIRSLENWHYNHSNRCLLPTESAYIKQKHDLLSVVPKEKTPLRRLLERWKTFRIHWFWKDNDKPELPLYDKDVVTYISDKRIDAFVNVVIIGVGLAMLIGPMWALAFVSQEVVKLGIITAFLVAFLGMIGFASVARPYEVLGAVAAYAAVLMVFLQLQNGNTPAP